MAVAFIERRPKSTDSNTATSHYVMVANGTDHGNFRTQEAAKDKACGAPAGS